MNQEKTCCVTGHRDIPEEKMDDVLRNLRAEVKAAVGDGYTRFISGFAQGTDLMFASVVVELRRETPTLLLEAAIPYTNRLKSRDPLFQNLLKCCNCVRIVCRDYAPNCYFLRNRYMVQESQRVIAVYDGREGGGTISTMRYAAAQKRELRVVRI